MVGPSSGVIYVMRSAVHADEVFKIGMTRRSSVVRGTALDRATGAPDKFLTVHEWDVEYCVEAERLVHAALDKYRINPRRKFFCAGYSVIHDPMQRVTEGQKRWERRWSPAQ